MSQAISRFCAIYFCIKEEEEEEEEEEGHVGLWMWMGLAIECAIWYYDAGCWCVRAPTGEKEREIYLSISSLYVRFLMPMGMMVSLTAAVLQQTHKYICIAPDRCRSVGRSGSVYRTPYVNPHSA